MQMNVAGSYLNLAPKRGGPADAPLAGAGLGFGAPRRISAKEFLVLQGDPHRTLFQVVSGAFALTRLSPDGRRQIVRFAFPGDLIGLHWDDAEPMSAHATCDSIVRGASFAAVLRAADEQPALRRLLGVLISQEMRELRNHITAVCAGGALQRVAFLLHQLLEKVAVRDGGRDVIVLPMTRLDMGDYLGLTIETVSREMSRLKAMGVIDIDRVTRIVVKCRRRLGALLETGADI